MRRVHWVQVALQPCLSFRRPDTGDEADCGTCGWLAEDHQHQAHEFNDGGYWPEGVHESEAECRYREWLERT